jgi:hypothetical protein
MWGLETYLITSNGTVDHMWESDYLPGISVRWLGNDRILRSIRLGAGPGIGGWGGGVQIQQADGTVTWDYRYNTNGHLSHHDIYALPNGNVLMIAWETKTQAEAIAAGRNPATVTSQGMMPDHIIEVKPTGPTAGDIVWEWHVWDHLIQDYDALKDNYGNVSQHPELVDVNLVPNLWMGDWMHTNSIDYDPALDQLLISIPNFDEIWIIDHSTTTQEAAGHTGGRYGHGGDLLYRWGNPSRYRAGTSADTKLFYQHGVSWIPAGLPGAGDILIFNNGDDRPEGQYSSIDEITPPIDDNGSYHRDPGSAFGPVMQTWVYTADPPESLYADHLSDAQRLANGDTLICNGDTGVFFEVTPTGSTVWLYTSQYPYPMMNELFKFVYIPPHHQTQSDLTCQGSLSWTRLQPGETATGNFTVRNIGEEGSSLNWTVNTSSVTWGNWTFAPQSGINLTPEDGNIIVNVTVTAPEEKHETFQGYIRVENRDNSPDFELIPVSLTTPCGLLQSHGFFFPLLRLILARSAIHFTDIALPSWTKLLIGQSFHWKYN